MSGAHARTQPRWHVPVAVAALLLVVAGALIAAFGSGGQAAPPAGAPTDLAGHPVQVDGASGPSATADPYSAAPWTGPWLTASSVSLHVPLRTTAVSGGVLTPPGFTSAYRVTNLGVDLAHASAGTVFVVAHALRGGGVAPGNLVENIKKGTSSLGAGDTVKVGSLTYRVTGSHLDAKSSIGDDSTVWANTPGRLVLITCMERPSGAAPTSNLVIEATLEH